MSIPILPQSQFNGDIFVSNFHVVHNLRKPPSVRLDPSHPFQRLWHSHLRSLSQKGGLFEGVIDCLAAILLGDPCWKQTTPTAVSQTRSDICSLLIRTPPNIIILSSLDDYACHVRCSALWNFVCISNFYVNLWMETKKPKHKVGLAALLITSMDHEIAHWAQSIRNGLYCLSPLSYISDLTFTSDIGPISSDDDSDDDDLDNDSVASSRVNEPEVSRFYTTDDSSDGIEVASIVFPVNEAEVPPFHTTDFSDNTEITPAKKTKVPPFDDDENPLLVDIPKAFQAPWLSRPIGEAGDFLEISTRGGIMEHDFRHQRVYLVAGEDDFLIPTKSYLDLYERNEGPPTSLVFCPASRKSLSHSVIKTKDAQAKFPFDGVDGCPTRRSYGRNRHHVPTKVLKL